MAGDKHFFSCTGVQQGDPLGPLLFALVLHPIIMKIKAQCPNLKLNAWYLDDGLIIGPIAEVRLAYEILQAEGIESSLEMSEEKCELFWPTANPEWNTFPEGIKRIVSPGVDLLGSFIGAGDIAEVVVGKRVDKIKLILSSLKGLDHAQLEYTLLRTCLGFPKMAFALRTAPPELIKDQCVNFDEAMHAYLSHLKRKELPGLRSCERCLG